MKREQQDFARRNALNFEMAEQQPTDRRAAAVDDYRKKLLKLREADAKVRRAAAVCIEYMRLDLLYSFRSELLERAQRS